MTDIDKIVRMAQNAGFSVVAPLDLGTICLYPEVREMCASDRCHAYDRNWTCPPACGTLEECSEKIRRYKRGIIVQTLGELEDDFDFEGMKELADKHNEKFYAFHATLSEIFPNVLALGAGGCSRCQTCTYPEAPCRFPHLALSSMEAYGMIVSEVCNLNGIPYYHGPGKIVYIGCYLFD
ncbi:MAG: DUF2284 domain-containing protein [Eubacteriales bacterium]